MNKKRILIIDDDVELGEELADLLLQEGYDVTGAHDAAQGESLISSHEYDVAILDFKMPGLNGIELVRRIKQKDSSSTKVVMITGKPFIEKLIKEENVGHLIDSLISKPFKINDLLEKIV